LSVTSTLVFVGKAEGYQYGASYGIQL